MLKNLFPKIRKFLSSRPEIVEKLVKTFGINHETLFSELTQIIHTLRIEPGQLIQVLNSADLKSFQTI